MKVYCSCKFSLIKHRKKSYRLTKFCYLLQSTLIASAKYDSDNDNMDKIILWVTFASPLKGPENFSLQYSGLTGITIFSSYSRITSFEEA